MMKEGKQWAARNIMYHGWNRGWSDRSFRSLQFVSKTKIIQNNSWKHSFQLRTAHPTTGENSPWPLPQGQDFPAKTRGSRHFGRRRRWVNSWLHKNTEKKCNQLFEIWVDILKRRMFLVEDYFWTRSSFFILHYDFWILFFFLFFRNLLKIHQTRQRRYEEAEWLFL